MRPGDLTSGEGVELIGCGPFIAPARQFMPRLHEPVPAGEAPEAAAARIRAGWPWAKLILDFPGEEWNPLAPRLSYEPAVVAEIAAAVHGAGGRLAVHVMGDHVDIAIDAGADSIEHANLADADASAARCRWPPSSA